MQIVGINLQFRETLRLNMLSLFYQFFVPLSVGADVTKFVKLKSRDHSTLGSVGAIVLDHFVGLMTLLIMSLGLFAWRRPVAIDVDIALAAAAAILLMIAVGVVAVRHYRRPSFNFASVLAHASKRRGLLLSVFAWSILMQLLLATSVYVGSLSWGLQIGFFDILFVLTTAFIFQALPLNIAGIGMAEVAGTGLYVALGLPVAAAVLLVSLLYAYRLLAAIIGGIWDLLPSTEGVATARPASDCAPPSDEA